MAKIPDLSWARVPNVTRQLGDAGQPKPAGAQAIPTTPPVGAPAPVAAVMPDRRLVKVKPHMRGYPTREPKPPREPRPGQAPRIPRIPRMANPRKLPNPPRTKLRRDALDRIWHTMRAS